MKAFRMKIIDLNLLFQFLKGRCYGNQFLEQIAKIAADFITQNQITSGSAGLIFTIFA